MRQFSVKLNVQNEKILQAIESRLAREARKYTSRITVQKGTQSANACRLDQLDRLHLQGGDILAVTTDGPDEGLAALALQLFFKKQQ